MIDPPPIIGHWPPEAITSEDQRRDDSVEGGPLRQLAG